MMNMHSFPTSAVRAGCLAASVFLFPLLPQLHATLIASESFDYDAGTPLGGQTGGFGFNPSREWTDSSAPDNEDFIRPGSLSYPGVTSSGNSVLMVSPTDITTPTSTRRLAIYKPAAGESTWVSFLFALENTSAPLSTADFASLSLSPFNAGGGVYFGVFDDPGSPGNKVFGIGIDDLSPVALSTISLVEGEVYQLAARIDWTDGNETITLYVNPTPGSLTPSAVTTDLDIVHPNNGTQLSSITLSAGGVGTEWAFDEILIGTLASDVMSVPEPSSVAFLFIAGVGMLIGRRKARS